MPSYLKVLKVIKDVHKHGIAHLDISPQNVVPVDIRGSDHETIYMRGQVFLIDYGASRKMAGAWRGVCRRVVQLYAFLPTRDKRCVPVDCVRLVYCCSRQIGGVCTTIQLVISARKISHGLPCTESMGNLTGLFVVMCLPENTHLTLVPG